MLVAFMRVDHFWSTTSLCRGIHPVSAEIWGYAAQEQHLTSIALVSGANFCLSESGAFPFWGGAPPRMRALPLWAIDAEIFAFCPLPTKILANARSPMKLHNRAISGFLNCGGTRSIMGGDDVFFVWYRCFQT